MNLKIPLILSLTLLSALPSFAADIPDLDAGFANPPASARPRTWWHWVSGNVSAEGITADLEAMHRIGLGGLQNFTVDQSAVHGPIKFMSPEWRNLVHHALTEAHRLNLDFAMEGCDGWSESGGPWITPDIAMQKIVYTERTLPGGHTIPLNLPQPETNKDFYRDIALFAFPVTADPFPAPAISSSADNFDASNITDNDPATTATLPAPQKPDTRFIQLQFDHPVTAESFHLLLTGGSSGQKFELQSSSDGRQFSHIAAIHNGRTTSFPPRPPPRSSACRSPSTIKKPPPPSTSLNSSSPANASTTSPASPASKSIATPTTSPPPTGPPIKSSTPNPSSISPAKPPGTLPPETGPSSASATPPSAPPPTPPLPPASNATSSAAPPSKPSSTACSTPSSATPPTTSVTPSPTSSSTPGKPAAKTGPPSCPPTSDPTAATTSPPSSPPSPAASSAPSTRPNASSGIIAAPSPTSSRTTTTAPGRDLAHQHNVQLTAEATGIGLPTVADQLQCKGQCDIPMGEFWINRSFDDNIDDPRETASAAHIYGQNIAATESFTATPNVAAWTNDPQSLKALGDFEFCQGINRFIFHRYAHQPWNDRIPGMTMGPWGINFERTNTWWNQGAAWISYLARSQFLLQQGRYAADILYFYGEGVPVTVSHRALTPPPPAGYSYDVCNAEILNRLSVDHGDLVLPSGMHYKLLILPNTTRMTLPLLQKIDTLVTAGATIYGPRPTASPTLANYPNEDDAIKSLAQKLWADIDAKSITEHPTGQGKIVLGEDLTKALPVPPDFQSTPNLLFIHRITPDADIYFLSNQQNTEVTAQCTFRIGNKAPELFHPDTGTTESPAFYQSASTTTTLPIHLEPIGSIFVIFRHPAATTTLASIQHDNKPLTPDDADLPTTTNNQTTLLAYHPGTYTLTTTDNKSTTLTAPALPAPLTLSIPWRITFPPNLGAPASAEFDHLLSWTDSKDPGIKYFSGTATYTTDFPLPDNFLQPNTRIRLNLGTVKNIAEVSVNSSPATILWKSPFQLDITKYLHPGTNHLEIKITNLWPNRLIGDQNLPENKRITGLSVDLYKPDSPLLPSGLLGPVTLTPAVSLDIK